MKRGYRVLVIQIFCILCPLILLISNSITKDIFSIWLNESFNKNSIDIINNRIENFQVWIVPIVAIIGTTLIYIYIRKQNKEKYFNFGNEYMDYPYFIFYLSGKILGFEKIQLKLIPIHTQFKIITNDTFKIIEYQEENIVSNESIVEFISNKSRSLTLVLIDTFPISIGQLNDNLKKTDILMITKGDMKANVRSFNTHFISTISEELYQREGKYTKINICATTNTAHTYRIVSDNFKKGKRGDIKSLFVYQQNREHPRVFEKSHEIKL